MRDNAGQVAGSKSDQGVGDKDHQGGVKNAVDGLVATIPYCTEDVHERASPSLSKGSGLVSQSFER